MVPSLHMMQAEKADKEKKRKEKQEAHLYTIIKVARDQDFDSQIGTTQFFDLVDHDKVSDVCYCLMIF